MMKRRGVDGTVIGGADAGISFWDGKALEYDEGKRDEGAEKLAGMIARDVAGGAAVLDVAAGTGGVAMKCAAVAGMVEAVDLSPEMIRVAARRLEAAGIGNVNFCLRSAADTGFPDGHFDSVVICNSLQFFEDPEGALAEARRVLKHGGLLVVPTACFGETEELGERARELIREGLPAYSLFTGDTVRGMIGRGGFGTVRSEWIGKDCSVFGMTMPIAYITARRE
jgi:SAM-dependent methyltransferase